MTTRIASRAPIPSTETRTDSRERRLFDVLRTAGNDAVEWAALPRALRQAGLRLDDPRLSDSLKRLETVHPPEVVDRKPLTYDEFVNVVKPNILVIERALQQSLVIPSFDAFTREIDEIVEQTRTNRRGQVANYIPQLGRVDPEQYGVSLCTIDGQRHSVGDAAAPFCTQSSCKPINYCLALEEHGEEAVHRHIGCEPSGHSFNELTLNQKRRPHNPMINAGAIMSCSLIKPDLAVADRFDYVLDMWAKLAGGKRPGFSNPTYLSERRTADRNFALGYFMREHGAFPEGTDLVDVLEFYFQCCSLEVTTDTMSIVAATMANGGVCPVTGLRVFRPDTVQKCLSLMYSCGMYDFSGEWAFRVGLPAKSGVSGVIMVVVPNVLGLCTFSPRLDELGNSVRGIEFCRQLVASYNFHNYDNLAGGIHGKKDPRLGRDHVRRTLLVDLCWAASEGDLTGIRRLVVQGVDLSEADYDGRTALHLAASEGRDHVVEYFIEQGIELSPVDRWGNTPLDDARRGGHAKVVSLLGDTGRGTRRHEA
jgi:glutaminase